MTETTPVLIVGAGPTGLAAACELLRLGVPVRVIEAEPERRVGTKAILLWPPTMDLFRGLGVLAEADRLGFRTRALNYHLSGGRTVRVPLDPENQPLMLPQPQTEAILLAALAERGGQVERGRRITDVAATGDLVTVKVTGPAGTELIEAGWLVAADGVRSTVREQLGIEFAGAAVDATFLLAEGQVGGGFDRGEMHYVFGRTGSLVVAPLPGDTVRISAPIPADFPLTREAVQGLVDERVPGLLQVGELASIGTFTSQERIAGTLRSGRCFLVGDAAHTHSPLGGQGLNLGLQDVRNLAWKLAGVIDGRLDPAVLDSYDAERRPVAEETLRLAGVLTRLGMLPPLQARVRNTVWSLLQRTGVLRRWYAPTLAGWRTHYPDVLAGAVPARRRNPAGRRTPSWVEPADVGTALRLHVTADAELSRAARVLADAHPGLVVHEDGPGPRAGYLLLRPDGYVAAGGRTVADLAAAERVLTALGPSGSG